jgi:hypothetical protein
MPNLTLARSTRRGAPSLTGRWRSAETPPGLPLNLEFTVREEDGDVSGHGEFAVGGVRGVPFALSGTHDHPRIRFTIHASGIEKASIGGTFVGTDSVSVLLTGSGFGRLPLLLQRTC